jgi:hypothetical protein
METVSEHELLALRAATRTGKRPWTSLAGKIRDWREAQKIARYRRRFRNAFGFFRVGVVAWRNLASISPEDRARLEARFRDAWRAEYRRRFVNRRLGWLFQVAIVLSYMAYFALLPWALPEKYRTGGYFDTLIFAFFGSYVVIVIGGVLVYWMSKYLDGRWAIAAALRGTGSVAVIFLIFMLMVFLTGQESADPWLLVLLGLMAWGFAFAAVLGFGWAALSAATNLVRRRDPDALLAASLFGALRSLEFNGDQWPNPNFRAGIAREFGAASTIARSFLFRKFDAADPETRLWQLRQANRIADGLAQRQRWLVTPKPDTYEFLLGAVSRSLVAVLSGNWDELARRDTPETAEPDGALVRPDMSRGRRALAMLLSGLQTIAVAALPAAALWMARSRDLLAHVDPRTLDYVEIGVFVWAVLILAFMLDPRLTEKISGAKDVISLLNPRKKGGD